MTQTTRGSRQFPLRLPDGWREKIKAEAEKQRRSMNAEIIVAIETAMQIKGVSLEAPGND